MTDYQTWRITQDVDTSIACIRHEHIRLKSQLEFARGLCSLHPEEATSWNKCIREAQRIFEAAATSGNLEHIRQAVREAEEQLSPLQNKAEEYTIYCVGHAHIDMNWQWGWPETVALTNDTFTTVLQLMDEFSEFHFSQSQASCYEIIEKHNPALLERIRQKVHEGRWELTASHWVENDKNLVSGEALCRHLLYTRNYLHSLFGDSADEVKIDWAPDTFGHAATVPTYLAAGGITRYFCTRPGNNGRKPAAFWWEAPDHSRVLVLLERENYNGRIEPESMIRKLLAFTNETGLPFVLHCYGVGDHGGGPTRQDFLYAREMNTWPIFPRLELTRTDTVFSRLEENSNALSVWTDELNVEFTGCYTSHAHLKAANRQAERGLLFAECAATFAQALGQMDTPSSLCEAWQQTLFTHFHDILPGTGIQATREHALGLLQNALATSRMTETLALRAIANHIDTSAPSDITPPPPVSAMHCGLAGGAGFSPGSGILSQAGHPGTSGSYPFVLFNLTPHAYSGVATVTLWEKYLNMPRALTKTLRETPMSKQPFVAVFPDGSRQPVQVIESGGYWHHEFVTLAVPVCDIPAFGYTTIRMEHNAPTCDIENKVTLTGGYNIDTDVPPPTYPETPVLENSLVRIEIDKTTGGLRSYRHLTSATELCTPNTPSALPELVQERPHPLTAWLPDYSHASAAPVVQYIEPLLRGPYRASLRVHYKINHSTMRVTYSLDYDSPALRIETEIDWRETGDPQTGVPVLRMAFPLPFENISTSYAIPFGSIERHGNQGEEYPALDWLCIHGTQKNKACGVLLANDSTHGYSLSGNILRASLLRSSYDPDPLPELGRHTASFLLLPYDGTLSDYDANMFATRLHTPIRSTGTAHHAGPLPATSSGLSITGASLLPLCIKQTEDKTALLLRIVNLSSSDVAETLTLDTAFWGDITDAWETDIYEKQSTQLQFNTTDNSIELAVAANALITLRITTKRISP